MSLHDIRNLDKDELLGIFGLEPKSAVSRGLAGALASFGVGLLAGAVVALLVAPKAGSALRQDLRAKLHCEGEAGDSGGQPRKPDEGG